MCVLVARLKWWAVCVFLYDTEAVAKVLLGVPGQVFSQDERHADARNASHCHAGAGAQVGQNS